MAKQIAHNLKSTLSIVKVNHFINELKFPSSDRLKSSVLFLSNNLGRLTHVLSNREVLENDCTYRDGIFLDSNRRVKIPQLSTKLIKSRIFAINNHEPVQVKEFSYFKKIIHPKEREIEFFYLHDVLLSNLKLHSMKLAESPDCPTCKVPQDSEHIFNSCLNSKIAWKAFGKNLNLITNPKLKSNVRSMIKRLLFLNKDKTLHENVVNRAIENRIQDFDKLVGNTFKQKNLKQLKSYALST